MTLPAKLQQMTGAIVILSYAQRLPGGKGYLIRFVPFEQNLGGTPEQQAGAINATMERLIARCPAQYFWSYNRYKTPPGVAAPLLLTSTTGKLRPRRSRSQNTTLPPTYAYTWSRSNACSSLPLPS